MLEKRRLGRTGFMVTALGLGGAWLGHKREGYDEERAIKAVLRALELGINLIDTSGDYGPSERFIGLALEGWYHQGGRREDLILCTKTDHRTDREGHFSAESTRKSLENSLKLLKTEYLDIYLIHDPQEVDTLLSPGAAWDTLKALKKEGLIRAMGLGARPHEFHRRLIETGDLDVSLTFADYNLLSQTAAEGVLAPAAAKDVGVLDAMVSMYGLLGGRDPYEVAHERFGWVEHGDHERAARFRPMIRRAREMWEWATERKLSFLALAIQYSLRDPHIASNLMGVSHAERIEEDVTAVQTLLAPQVWAEFEERFGLPRL
jgi:aryl-alcohol dehydrogenase-like predicted oxidoreductase